MKREKILEHRDERVLTLVMNRPDARNAFDSQQWRELRDALAGALADDGVGAVMLTGAPGAFTAGQDLSEMAASPDGGEHPFGSCMQQLIDFDKPLLAAVNGVGVGFGLTVLLHCDVVHIAAGARLRVPFVSLGVVPEAASSFLLPRLVGHQRAAEILLTDDWVSSERAVEIGLALREYPPDELLPATLALAHRMASYPLGAVRATKRLMKAGSAPAVRAARAREDIAFTERIGTPENLEAIRRFFERRR